MGRRTYRLEEPALEDFIRRQFDAPCAQEVVPDVVPVGGCEGGRASGGRTYVGMSGNMVWIWSTWNGCEQHRCRHALGQTISWVTCLGLKPSAALADRALDAVDEPGEKGGEARARRRRRGTDSTWPIER